MNLQNSGKRLKFLREKLGISQIKFAESIGIAQTTLSAIERGVIALTQSNAINVEYIYGVSSGWLLEGNGDMMLDRSFGVPLQYREMFGSSEGPGPEFINIYYHNIYTDNHDDNKIVFEKIEKYQPFHAGFIENTLSVSSQELMIVVAKGDSMKPTISNRDILLVHRVPQYQTDGIYVVRQDVFIFVKRLQYRNHQFHLISDNEKYQPEIITYGDTNFSIIGRVIWVGKVL